MGALEYDYKTGTYRPAEDEEDQLSAVKPVTMSYQPPAAAVGNPQQEMLDRSAALVQKKQVGILPQGIGGTVSDAYKASANVITGMGTGIVDLGLMAVDAARASTGDFGGLTKFGRKSALGWDEVGESRDNPLTAWRIKNLTPDSEAFKVASYMGEVASWFINPKGVLKFAGRAATLGRAGKLGVMASKSDGIVGGLKALAMEDEALGGLIRGFKAITKADDVAPGIQNAQKAFKSGVLQGGSKVDDYVKLMAGENPIMARQMQSALRNSMSANPLTRRLGFISSSATDYLASPVNQKMRMFGEVVVKDAYANFMTQGTRELSEEESGIARWVAGQTRAWPMIGAAAQSLVPQEQDAALVARGKMLLEGTLISFITQPLVDTARLGWMARKLDLANLDHRQQVLRILNTPELAGDLVAQKLLKAADAITDPARLLPGDRPGGDRFTREPAAPTLDDLRARREAMQQGLTMGQLGEIPDLDRINAGRAPKPQWEDAGRETADAGLPPLPEGAVVDENALPPPLPTPEPVFSPGAMRSAADQELSQFMAANSDTMTNELLTSKVEEVGGKLMALMPKSRQARVDYLKQFTPMINRAGVVHPIDGIWYNSLVKQGLDEGWAKVDDNWGSFSFNRKAALEVEESEQTFRLADEMDKAAADKRLLEGPAASEQTVDVQAQAVPEEAAQLPEQAAAPEQAPGLETVGPMTMEVPPEVQGVAAADAKVGLAEQDLAQTQAEAASRQQAEPRGPDVPVEQLNEVAPVESTSVADMFEAANNQMLESDRRTFQRVGQSMDKINAGVDELAGEGAPPAGQAAKALPSPEEVAAKEAADAEALAQEMRDQSYEPVPIVIPPKLTDAVTVKVQKLGRGEGRLLQEVLATTDYKFTMGTSTAEIGSKAVGDVLDLLGEIKLDGTPQEIRTATTLERKLRATLAQNAEAINQQSTIEDLVRETQNLLLDGEICDLGGML